MTGMQYLATKDCATAGNFILNFSITLMYHHDIFRLDTMQSPETNSRLRDKQNLPIVF